MTSTLRQKIRRVEARLLKVHDEIIAKEVRRDLLARQARSYRKGTREYQNIAREHDKLNIVIVDLNKDRDDLQDELDSLNRAKPHHYDRYEGHRHQDGYMNYDDASDSQEWLGYGGD